MVLLHTSKNITPHKIYSELYRIITIFMTEWTFNWEHKIIITTPKGYKREETDKAYTYFQYYRSLGYKRTYTKVAEHFNVDESTIRKYADKYMWDMRLNEEQAYIQFSSNADLIEGQKNLLKFNQEDTENNNKVLLKLEEKILIDLGFIPNPKTRQYEPDPNLDFGEAMDKLIKIMYMKSRNKDDGYRAYGLPKNINDDQKYEANIKHDGFVGVQMVKNKQELDQEYEDRFKQYLEDITTNNE